MLKNILVVDDEDDILKQVVKAVVKQGFLVHNAANGEEGLEKVKTTKPHLVIVDVYMPKLDGYSFVVDLRKNPETRDIPVIVLTNKEQMQEMFEIQGVSAYLKKPFNEAELNVAIKKALG